MVIYIDRYYIYSCLMFCSLSKIVSAVICELEVPFRNSLKTD